MADFCAALSSLGVNPGFCKKWIWGGKVEDSSSSALSCSEAIVEDEKDEIVFQNMSENRAEVVFPYVPLYIEKTGAGGEDLAVSVNGKLLSVGEGWVMVPLEEGKNTVEAKSGDLSEEVELVYTPGFSAADQTLLYTLVDYEGYEMSPYSSEGAYLIVTGLDERALFGAVKIFPGAKDVYVLDLLLSPDGARLYILQEKAMEVFDLSTHKRLYEFNGMENMSCFSLTPDGSYLFLFSGHSYDTEGLVKVLDAQNGEEISSFTIPLVPVNDALILGEDNNIFVRRPFDISILYAFTGYQASQSFAAGGEIKAMLAHPQQEEIVLLGFNFLSVFDVKGEKFLNSKELPTSYSTLIFSPDGKVLYLGGESAAYPYHSMLTAYDYGARSFLWEKELSDDLSNPQLIVSPAGERLFAVTTAYDSARIVVFDPLSGEESERLPFIPAAWFDQAVLKPKF